MLRRGAVPVLVGWLCATAWACGGRNLDAGPTVIVVDDDDGGFGGGFGGDPGSGGFGGEGGDVGGMGGEGGDGGSGGEPPMPLDCLACIGTQCPQALACVTDPGCIQGVVCAVGQCLGGGGMPDIMCLIDCFDGDIDAALNAIDTLTCVFGSCGDECAGLIPGGFP